MVAQTAFMVVQLEDVLLAAETQDILNRLDWINI